MQRPRQGTDSLPDRFPKRFQKPSLGITPGVTPGFPLRGTWALTDSGAITQYRPGQLVKPDRVLAAFGRKVKRYEGNFIPAKRTTQQGSSAASPATFYPSLWPQRFEKSFYIADCFQLYYTDPAAYKSVNMFVNEAVRGGVKILVMGTDAMSREAQQIADEYVENLWSVEALFENAVSMLLAGDLYLQAACIGQAPDARIDHFLTMPAAGMERCTDDADQFTDPRKAFSQVDTLTWGDVAYFPLWSMEQVRWNHVAGERYGTPEILTARNIGRQVQLCETAKVVQNQGRASMKLHWKIGTEENPASPEEVEDFMALNGYQKGIAEVLDPNQAVRDIWTNAVSEIKAIEGDANTHQIDHIKYLLDRYTNGLPTPAPLMHLITQPMNRDVLKDIRAQWMADTQRVNRAMEKVIMWGYRLQLMLQNIDPDLVIAKCIWSKSTIMTEQEQVEMHVTAVESGLESAKQARAQLQSVFQTPDLDEEEKQIKREQNAKTDQEMKMRSAGATVADKLRDEGHSLNGNRTKSYPVRSN